MFCPNCGTKIEGNARYCPDCGSYVADDFATQGTAGGSSYAGNTPQWQDDAGSGNRRGESSQWQENAGSGNQWDQSSQWQDHAGGTGSGDNQWDGTLQWEETPAAPGGKPGDDKKRILLIAGGIVLLLLVVGIGAWGFFKGKAAKKAGESTAAAYSENGSNNGNAASQSGNGGTGISNGSSSGNAGSTGNVSAGNSSGISASEAGQVLSGAAGSAGTASALPASGAPKITDADITMSQGALAKQIEKLNTGNAEQKIDVFADNYKPVRNASLYWDNSLFYSLEDVFPDRATDGKINGYFVTRKAFINAATGNRMEYEIYAQPGSGTVNKIVSIEYMADHLEITDYYYLDNGKVSFIFVRDDVNYVPSYAVPTKDGQRFYFNSDCMVKWRIVSGGTITNYCIGKPSANENKNGGEVLYDSLNASLKASYDETERNMLNAAYNTYNMVLSAQSIAWITGFVYNGQERARSDSNVYLRQGEEYLYKCNPDQDGSYFIAVPGTDSEYQIVIVTERCDTCIIYNVGVSADVVYTYVDTAYIMEQSDTVYQQVLQVRDALNYAADGQSMMAVPNAEVYIRYGINSRDTKVVASGVTDSLGNLNISLMPGMYTAEVRKSGYDIIFVTICIRVNLGTVEVHFSPSLPQGEMRIVLSWGALPFDLDSHLFTPYDSSLGDAGYHIFFSNPYDEAGDNLDVDDTYSYGPETITIPVVKNGLYKYYVVDYSNASEGRPTSYEMSNSGAVVNVYASTGLVATFHVPTGMEGVIWEVFEIRNGQIIPNQRYYSNIDGTNWWHR